MCGIIGEIGKVNVMGDILDGLKKLEYRGYDSAGVAVFTDAGVRRVRAVGSIAALEEKLRNDAPAGTLAIGHTRWATNGKVTEANAHPHRAGKFTAVHNGIIENAAALKAEYFACDAFESETDTEVVAKLLDRFYTGDVGEAIRRTEAVLTGSWALGILCDDCPGTLFAAAYGSPLLVIETANGRCIASDAGAVQDPVTVTKLENREYAALTANAVTIYNEKGEPVQKAPLTATAGALTLDKGGYEHYMMSEIMQQPEAVRRTLEAVPDEDYIRDAREIVIVACGSAYHTGLVGARLFESVRRIRAHAEIASEFRYADPIIGPETLCIFVSQSGETADTLAALRLAKEKGARTLAIVNVPGSAIATESDEVILTRAGREIAVATTKAYSAQLAVFYCLALGKTEALGRLPEAIYTAIAENDEKCRRVAERIAGCRNIFFIGRLLDNAVSQEGSLKMKEISYLNSQAYAAGELKHGTISLVEPGAPVIATVTDETILTKTASNLHEVKARGAFTIVIAAKHLADKIEADLTLTVPDVGPLLSPSVAVVPMQLMSYYTAKALGCEIDKPRNLAKSVTVE